MSDEGYPEKKQGLLVWALKPWGIGIILLAIFFLGEGYLALRDSAIEAALDNDTSFAAPVFDVSFSKKLPYDPLSFIGRGARAGLWKWTPDALVLTDDGLKYFTESGDLFVSLAPAGKRRILRIRTNTGLPDGDRRLDFIFEWQRISPPAAAILTPPPQLKEEYPGEAVMTKEGGQWKVKSVLTKDYDDSLSRLKDAASGVLR